MASTVLPNGIIVPEKFSRDWYADLYHNWQELDNLLGGGTPKDGTLTIQKNGDTVGTFTANSSTDKTVDITVPTKTSDLTNDSGFITEDNTKIPLAGSNQISGDLIPSTDGTVNLGGSSYQWKDVQTEKINNLNPGALSLSSIARVKLDTTDFVWDGVTQNVIEPPVPCILYILVTASKIVENGTISAGNMVMYTSSQIIKNNVSNCGSNNNYAIASVQANAGDRVVIRLSLSSSSLSGNDGVFYRPLLGNV